MVLLHRISLQKTRGERGVRRIAPRPHTHRLARQRHIGRLERRLHHPEEFAARHALLQPEKDIVDQIRVATLDRTLQREPVLAHVQQQRHLSHRTRLVVEQHRREARVPSVPRCKRNFCKVERASGLKLGDD